MPHKYCLDGCCWSDSFFILVDFTIWLERSFRYITYVRFIHSCMGMPCRQHSETCMLIGLNYVCSYIWISTYKKLFKYQELTPEAEIISTRYTKSVIKSCAALSYVEAQARMDDRCFFLLGPLPFYNIWETLGIFSVIIAVMFSFWSISILFLQSIDGSVNYRFEKYEFFGKGMCIWNLLI